MHICIYQNMEHFVTSVKLDLELYNKFKETNIRKKISLQDFVNKCMEKYLQDDGFANDISQSIFIKKPTSTVTPNVALDTTVEDLNRPFQFSTPCIGEGI